MTEMSTPYNSLRPDIDSVSVIGLPYLFGTRAPSPRNHMAQGPAALLSNAHLRSGIAEHFSDAQYVMIEDADEPPAEQTAGYDSFNVVGLFQGDQLSRMRVQNARLAEEVRKARSAGRIPLAATGACSAAVGMVAGLADAGAFGMVWFDAHEDASTPETSLSGLLEGMPVAMVAGRCWQAYCGQIPGFRSIPTERIVSIGLHDSGFTEERREASILENVVAPPDIAKIGFETAIAGALDGLSARCSRVYVHIDVDVLDPSVALSSHHMAYGGLTLERLHAALSAIADRFEIIALDYSCFDPSLDNEASTVLAQSMVFAAQEIQRSIRRV